MIKTKENSGEKEEPPHEVDSKPIGTRITSATSQTDDLKSERENDSKEKAEAIETKQMSKPPRRVQVQVWFWSIIPLFSSPYTPIIHIITILHHILPSTLHCHHHHHHHVGWDLGADTLLFSLATAAALSAEKRS